MEAALKAIAAPRRRQILQLVRDDELSAGDKVVFATLTNWFGGANAYFQSCKKLDTNSNARDHDSGSMPTYMGNTYCCLTPWMIEVLKLRRSAPDPKTEKEAWIEWQTKVIEQLVKGIPSARLMKVARKDGFFFQVQVNGFRKGDHQAKDSELEELIASYVSDTVGTVDQDRGGGAFNDMASKTGITNYELSALFFTGGD